MTRLKKCHTLKDCLYWNLFGLIPLSLALAAISASSRIWMVVYLLVYAGHFLILEYRFFCTHCPHYGNGSATTNCMFLWLVPKFFKKDPGPLSRTDLAMTGIGFAIAIFFPLYWLIRSLHLALPYFLSWAVLLMTVNRYECGRCIFFNCPANTVCKKEKEDFISTHPPDMTESDPPSS